MQEDFERKREIAQRIEAAGRHILINARNELYLHMRFMDVALSSLSYVYDGSVSAVAVDGNCIYYDGKYLGAWFREDRKRVNRAYLHMVLHCIFGHVFRRAEDIRYWDLACDIAIESVIDDMQIRCIKTPVSWTRENVYRELRRKLKVLTAEGIYRVLKETETDERRFLTWVQEFTVDDHSRWCREPKEPKNQQTRDKWRDISEKMEMDLDSFSKEASQAEGGLKEQLRVAHRDTMDYRTFLQKFAVIKEEMQVDPDQFDYIFYSYGLSMYGNMPLIEPQETREVRKIEEFAVVIDTSMSCSGDLVKAFLEETYGILREQENFFHKINLHIIQCDERVQSDVKVANLEELNAYMESFEVIGSGGTDFRPAFAYVEKLCREKEFTNLKGLLYFTDGFGIYPKSMPPWQTAFVFLDDEEADTEVPPWAIKVILSRRDLKRV
ncbi:MAG: VWA-like domain-containing protein [Eubacteriales bacterium]|nr:VWA-like domain-containing protein [Eubacteriales bacterium]